MKKAILIPFFALYGLTILISCDVSNNVPAKPFVGASAATATPTSGGSGGSGGGGGGASASPTPQYFNNYGTSAAPNGMILTGPVPYGAPVTTLTVAEGEVKAGGDVTMIEQYSVGVPGANQISGGPIGNCMAYGIPTPNATPPYIPPCVAMVNPQGLAYTPANGGWGIGGWYAVLDSLPNSGSGGATMYESSLSSGYSYNFNGVSPTYGNSYGGSPFNNPKGICADTIGDFYVADTGNGYVDMLGLGAYCVCPTEPNIPTWLHRWNGSASTFPFKQPYAVACDANNDVYVADVGYTPSAIEEFSSGGTTFIAAHSFSTVTGCIAHGIAVDPNGNVYVADAGNGAVEEYSPTGFLMRTLGDPHSPHEFLPFGPSSVVLYYAVPGGALTNIIVGDANNDLIQVFGP